MANSLCIAVSTPIGFAIIDANIVFTRLCQLKALTSSFNAISSTKNEMIFLAENEATDILVLSEGASALACVLLYNTCSRLSIGMTVIILFSIHQSQVKFSSHYI